MAKFNKERVTAQLEAASVEELKEVRTLVARLIRNIEKNAAKVEVVAELAKLMKEKGISAADLASVKPAKRKRKPNAKPHPMQGKKYPMLYTLKGTEWSGRGTMPKVFKTATKGDREKLKKYLIKK